MKNKHILILIAILIVAAELWTYKNQYGTGPTGSVPQAETKQQTYKPLPAPSKTQGTVVFAIKDAGVSLDTIASINFGVKEILVSGPKGWKSVSKNLCTFNKRCLHF